MVKCKDTSTKEQIAHLLYSPVVNWIRNFNLLIQFEPWDMHSAS